MSDTYLQNLEVQRQRTEQGYATRNAFTLATLNMRTDTRDTLREALRVRNEDITDVRQQLQNLHPRGTSTHPALQTIELTNRLHALINARNQIHDQLDDVNVLVTKITNERNNERLAYENRIHHLDYMRFKHIFSHEENIINPS
tara:strand:+ start:929 stop:1360 length:432 start_codon:yes stop_codon:yes gene_type:complete